MNALTEAIQQLRLAAAAAYRNGHKEVALTAFTHLDKIRHSHDVSDRVFLGTAMLQAGEVEESLKFVQKAVLTVQPYDEVGLLLEALARRQLKRDDWTVGCKTIVSTSQDPELRAYARHLIETDTH